MDPSDPWARPLPVHFCTYAIHLLPGAPGTRKKVDVLNFCAGKDYDTPGGVCTCNEVKVECFPYGFYF
jgi:hypothetical protein